MEIWKALKALVPLFGPRGDRLVVDATPKEAALRYLSALTLISLVVWALEKAHLGLLPVPVRGISGVELDPKVQATIVYGLFFGCVALLWAVVLFAWRMVAGSRPNWRLSIVLPLGSATMILVATTFSFVLAGLLQLFFSGPTTLIVAGTLFLALIFYCIARVAFWISLGLSLSSTAAATITGLFFLFLSLMNYLLIFLDKIFSTPLISAS